MTSALPVSFARCLRRTAEAARRWKLRAVGTTHQAPPKLDGAGVAARHIAIVGAGLSGLCAAYLLSQAGQQVTVLEARDQPGGRVLTLRNGLAPGVHADAGAARIADIHNGTLAWIEHFGLVLEPMYPDTGRLIGERAGRAVAGADASRLSSHDIHHILIGQTPWEEQWSASRSARILMRNSLIKPVWHRIRDGMDRLPRAFAKRLGGNVRCGAAVKAIMHDARGVDVRFQEAHADRGLRADFVVCALPYAAQRAIHVSPPLADDKRKIIDRSQSEPATRVFLQLRDRASISPGWSGFGVTHDRWEIWQSRFPSTQRCVLTVYAQGDAAAPLAALSPEKRIATAMQRVENLFPGVRERCEAALQISWEDNPWSLGARQIGEVPLDVATRIEGRLHFAGAHTSTTGWMEGALESGHRVAAEILRRVRA